MDGGYLGAAPRPSLQSLQAEGHGAVGIVVDRYLTVIAVSPLARALVPGLATGTNLAKFVFLDQRPGPRSTPWQQFERLLAAMLRESADRHRDDLRFRGVVGELCALSRVFAAAWAMPVDVVADGEMEVRSDGHGALTLTYRTQRHQDDYDDIMFVFSPTDQSSRDALARLRAALPETP